MLLAVLFLVALVLIMLAVAAPKMARSIQREKEIELVHRGEQYKRAIKLYYKKFGSYPTSIDQLVQTNNIRFLRKRYTDPITGKDDWRIIHLGQAKVPPMGLFGQPLTGLPGQTGVGTTIGGASGGATNGSAFGSPSGSSAFGATPGSSAFGSPSGSSAFGSTPVDTSNSDSSDNGQLQLQNVPEGTAGSLVTIDSQPGSSTPGGANGTGSSAFGATLGGGPIVGVGIPSEKASLIEYKKQKHYNQWEFVYNPIEDQLQGALGIATGAGAGSGLGSGTNNSGGFGSGGFGQNPGNSGGFGQSTGIGPGNSGTTGTSPPLNSDSQQQ